jgi:hypothetical protein
MLNPKFNFDEDQLSRIKSLLPQGFDLIETTNKRPRSPPSCTTKLNLKKAKTESLSQGSQQSQGSQEKEKEKPQVKNKI